MTDLDASIARGAATPSRRRSAIYRSLPLLLVSAICGLSYGLIVSTGSIGDQLVTLSTEGPLNFGAQWSDPAFVWKFSAINQSNEPLTITDITPQCTCAAITPTIALPRELQPGESIGLEMVLDLRPSKSYVTATEWPFETTIVASISGGNTPRSHLARQPLKWRIHGLVRNPVVVAHADELHITAIAGTDPQQFTLESVVSPGVNISSASLSDNLGSVCLVSDVTNKDKCSFQIVPSRFLNTGRYTVNLSCHGTVEGSSQILHATLPLAFDVLAPVSATPSLLAFGELALGESRTETLQLTSHVGRSFEVLGISFPQHSGMAILESSHSIDVTQLGIASGVQYSSLGIDVGLSPDSPPWRLTIPVTYVGESSAIRNQGRVGND